MSQKNLLIRGTLILTVSGLLTRVLGFFYRIFLADALGAEALGIYQLIFPVYGLCFTLFAAGNQTALSKIVASRPPRHHLHLLARTLLVALVTAAALCLLVNLFAPFIADRMLMEPRSSDALRILAWCFPFCAVTSCINGFYYGRKKAAVPAATQFLEQLVRLAVVCLIVRWLEAADTPFTCELAVLALLAGEIASMVFNSTSLLSQREKSPRPETNTPAPATRSSRPPFYPELFHISLPITGNRFTINLLHSAEMVLLPAFLKLSGVSSADALALYGILNGMAMPFILFPSTITNSLSVMLLPTVANAAAAGQNSTLAHTITTGIRYSILISILCTGVFLVYGGDMGTLVFHNNTAGSYIRILSWLCPFLYLNTTLGSVLNGLDRAPAVFLQNVIASSLRILFLLFLVPRLGMTGYLWGMLAGSLCLTLLHMYSLYKTVPGMPLPGGLIAAGSLTVSGSLWLSKRLPLNWLQSTAGVDNLYSLAFRCLFVCLIFLLFFLAVEQKNREKIPHL